MTGLTGLGRLIRFILRRDRVRLTVWVVAIAGITISSGASLPTVYPDQASVDTYVRLFGDNPALIAFAGPGYGFDDPNIGLVLVNETQLNGIIFAALMSIFLINRHTRAEEESERAELIRSSVIGRHAPDAAAAIVVATAHVVIGLLIALGFIASDYQMSGSLALAGSITCAGLLFAGIALVAAQITSSGRATLGMASSALGVAFVIRAVGDVADNGLSWLSPIGWTQAVRAFADERWWTLGLSLVVAAGLSIAAFWLSTRRDLGSGLIPQRPGRARSPGWMTKPLGLAFRLQRGALLGWMIAMFLFGYIFGSIGRDIEQMLEENQMMADMLAGLGEGSVTDSYFGSSMSFLGMMVGGFAVASVLRLATEESGGRAEPILAATVSRVRWGLSHVVFAVAGTIAIMAFAGLGLGIAWAAITSDASQIPRMVGAALVPVPAILLVAGISVAMFGAFPSLARASWAGLGVVVGIGFFGEVLRLPEWVRSISPFDHLPAVPAEELVVLPVVVITLLAAALIGAGLWRLRVRDLHTE